MALSVKFVFANMIKEDRYISAYNTVNVSTNNMEWIMRGYGYAIHNIGREGRR